MAQLKCSLYPNKEEIQSLKMTVGDVVHLSCQNSEPSSSNIDFSNLDDTTLEMRVDAEFKDAVKLLKVNYNSDTLNLKITSYLVGKHQIPAVQLVDKNQALVLGDWNFEVLSVQDPQKPVKEPMGPIGALGENLDPFYWIFPLVILFFLMLSFTYGFLQKRKYKKRLQEMKLDQYGKDPITYFYSQMRKAQRNYLEDFQKNKSAPTSNSSQDLNQEETQKKNILLFLNVLKYEIEIYLSRKFVIPAIYLKPKQIIKKINQKYSYFREDFGKPINEWYREWELNHKKFVNPSKEVNKESSIDLIKAQKDSLQIFKNGQRMIEKIDQWLKKQENL